MDPPVRTLEFLVHGRVQGVGFRYATRARARELGLAGWVRNERDGRVRVRAAGDPASMDQFAAWLAKGPPLARVLEVEIVEAAGSPLPRPFAIER